MRIWKRKRSLTWWELHWHGWRAAGTIQPQTYTVRGTGLLSPWGTASDIKAGQTKMGPLMLTKFFVWLT